MVFVFVLALSINVFPDLDKVSHVWLLVAFQLDWLVVIVAPMELSSALGFHDVGLTVRVAGLTTIVNSLDALPAPF